MLSVPIGTRDHATRHDDDNRWRRDPQGTRLDSNGRLPPNAAVQARLREGRLMGQEEPFRMRS